jgi:hypothetical protein
MNNTKWHKLLEHLTNSLNEVCIKYKLVYDDVIEDSIFDTPDFQPFFIEPITYKEVEWIEFPANYDNWINPNNLKAGKTTFKQDLAVIKTEIDKIGQSKLEQDENTIRLYGYLRK